MPKLDRSYRQKARGGHSMSKRISQARSCGRQLQLYLEMAGLVQKACIVDSHDSHMYI